MRYKISGSLAVQFGTGGQLVATASMSRPFKKIETEILSVLQAFGDGNTAEDVKETLIAEGYEMEDGAFEEIFTELVDGDLLVPVDAGEREENLGKSASPSFGFGTMASHHFMLQDSLRVMAYRNAIFANVRGRSVVEIGCGTGILSIFAAQAGARKVVAIEEGEVAELAKQMIKANGLENIIDVVVGNSRDVELEEPADVIVHEIIGNEAFGERMLPVLEDARQRFFKDGSGLFLPGKIDICCAAVEIDDTRQNELLTMIRDAQEFSSQYGVDFGPYIERLESRQIKKDHFVSDVVTRFPYPVLSGEHLLSPVDFSGDWQDIYSPKTTTLTISREGVMNGVVIFFRAHLDERIRLSNSPFAPRTHWGWSIKFLSGKQAVEPGQEVSITSKTVQKYGSNITEVDFTPG